MAQPRSAPSFPHVIANWCSRFSLVAYYCNCFHLCGGSWNLASEDEAAAKVSARQADANQRQSMEDLAVVIENDMNGVSVSTPFALLAVS